MRYPNAPHSRRHLALRLVAGLILAQPALADPFATAVADAAAGRHGEAAAGFHALALSGDAEAAYNLALLFMSGQGLPQNHIEAAYWAWQARLAGLTQAGPLLSQLSGRLDRAGQQSVADRLEAALSPLAAQGDGAAMLSLAAVMQHVRPTPDLSQAHAWQSIAAALDVPGAIVARDASLQAMDTASRTRAEAEAMAAFQAWCRNRGAAAPASCSVVQD